MNIKKPLKTKMTSSDIHYHLNAGQTTYFCFTSTITCQFQSQFLTNNLCNLVDFAYIQATPIF